MSGIISSNNQHPPLTIISSDAPVTHRKTSKHIRPKVRNRRGGGGGGGAGNNSTIRPTPKTDDDLDDLLETTRRRILRCTLEQQPIQTESTKTTKASEDVVSETKNVKNVDDGGCKKQQTTGILKTSKYGRPTSPVAADDVTLSSINKPKRKPVLKDMVVERRTKPSNRLPKRKSQTRNESASMQVEGYTPTTIHPPKPNTRVRDVSELLLERQVLSQHAASLGLIDNDDTTLLDDNDRNESKTVEADVSFACMTPKEYDDALALRNSIRLHDPQTNDGDTPQSRLDDDDTQLPRNEDRQSNHRRGAINNDRDDPAMIPPQGPFFGRVLFPIPNAPNDDDDDRDSFRDLFTEDDDDDIEQPLPPPEPRPFLILWNALTSWITPQTTEILRQWNTSENNTIQSSQPPIQQTTDIATSRFQGLISLLKLNIPHCFETCQIPPKHHQTIETRLFLLARSFDYSQPMVKLNPKLWSVMTMILIAVVVMEDWMCCEVVPLMVEEVGMTLEEYRYLVKEAFVSLSRGSG